jgi:ACS family sodium-dependent inorganic phosphate cotransporter
VASIPTAGLIAGLINWEAVFYIHGGLSLIWCVLWVLFVSDTPSNHKFISEAEKDYILTPIDAGDAANGGGGHGAPVKTVST